MRWVFDRLASESRTYETRDRIMALYAPIGLFALVFSWMALVIGGFTLIYYALIRDTWHDAFELSGSSFFTLGFELPSAGVPGYVAVFAEAATGLAILALLIAYLPTIYAAFSRREREVARLATLAGTPPSGVELLIRYHRIDWNDHLPRAVEGVGGVVRRARRDPHVARRSSRSSARRAPIAPGSPRRARSSTPRRSRSRRWRSRGRRRPGCASAAASLALREIAGYYDIPVDPDPAPDAPISIAKQEFFEAYEELGGAGAPIRPDRERCWRDFAGWRVNYDAVLLGLASLTMAPYAPWSSDRSLRARRPRIVHSVRRSGPR